ncbi:MAG: SapC family protein [Alphaproteobacteria bacterium]|nr:SapC family protein [Alphaproteobacteria bacterium]
MAAAPQNALPLFYNQLVPISLEDHGNLHARRTDKAAWLAGQHAIPLTVEEFPMAQRDFPIVFSVGDNPVPLGLMGMSEGVNVFVSDDGVVEEGVYVPAYARRYPFMLAKLTAQSEELSLCFDPTSDLVGTFEEGSLLFEDGQPSEHIRNTLSFCEQFEIAGNKTANFVKELEKHELLMDGELTFNRDDLEKPMIYRGFKIVSQDKLRDLRGDLLRTWNKNGMLALIYAHLISLDLVRDVFARQAAQGKLPNQALAETTDNA